MEALGAVGLASNVLQFVEFATKIVRASNELRQDVTSAENRDHAAVAAHLRDLTQKMLDESRAADRIAVVPSPEEKAYQAVLDGCSDLAKQLLKRMEGCGVNQGQPKGLVRRTRRAFKCVWNKQEINDINTRLQNFRGEINAYCIYRIRKTQLEDRVNQPCKADLEIVVAQVARLGASVEGLSLRQSSLGTDLDSSRRMTLEALSRLKSDNMQLVTGVNQATSALSGQKMLLQTLLQETLGEFRKEMLPLVKSEFHSVAEVELAKAHGLMLHEVRGMLFEQMMQGRQSDNHASTESQQSCDTMASTSASIVEDMTLSSKDRGLHDSDLLANRGPERTHESSTIVTYNTTWKKKTAFAKFQVRSRHTVSFDQQFRATEIYEITAQVLPTSRWFATGCEINFKRMTDVRGVPSWTWKQPQTYRVLNDDDKVFQCIRDNDIDTVRTMLSNKTMFPSDRNHIGFTPLHSATLMGNVEICRSLLQCGADPHAQDLVLGYTPAFMSLIFNGHVRRSQLHAFSCLGQAQQQLDIPDMESLVFGFASATFDIWYNEQGPEQGPKQWVLDWVLSCRLLGIDFQESDNVETQEKLFGNWAIWDKRRGGLLRRFLKWNGPDVPSIAVDRVLEVAVAFVNSLTTTTSNGIERRTRTNTGIAASCLAWNLVEASEVGALHKLAGDGHEFAYRGFFVDPDLWVTLKFLDTVILNDIDAHPDSIFDTFKGATICTRFGMRGFGDVWEDILEEHGFDPGWAWEEDERRKNFSCANATGHDAELETPASQALDVKRRRAYAADDGA